MSYAPSQTVQPSRVALIGPQTDEASVGPTLDALGVSGAVGLITAGWRDAEADLSQLDKAVRGRSRLLPLYTEAERVWGEDSELSEGHHSMQQAARTIRRAYNIRLAHYMEAAAAIAGMGGQHDTRMAETARAAEAIRELDRLHLERMAGLRAEFFERFQPHERPAVVRVRNALAEALGPLEAVVIEGGHVAILLNRMRLFDVASMLAGKTVIARSGGAMVLAERLVLFHDSPPQGPGHPEVLEHGLGLYPDIVPLPHAEQRLRLDNPVRVARMAQRFAPSACVILDPPSRIVWTSDGWSDRDSTTGHRRRLALDGTLPSWEIAA